jgi:hypothetical protein
MRPNESLQATTVHAYGVCPRKDHRGVDLIRRAAIRSAVVHSAG